MARRKTTSEKFKALLEASEEVQNEWVQKRVEREIKARGYRYRDRDHAPSTRTVQEGSQEACQQEKRACDRRSRSPSPRKFQDQGQHHKEEREGTIKEEREGTIKEEREGAMRQKSTKPSITRSIKKEG